MTRETFFLIYNTAAAFYDEQVEDNKNGKEYDHVVTIYFDSQSISCRIRSFVEYCEDYATDRTYEGDDIGFNDSHGHLFICSLDRVSAIEIKEVNYEIII